MVLVIFTARKRSLGQGNVFTHVCHSVRKGEGVSVCLPDRDPLDRDPLDRDPQTETPRQRLLRDSLDKDHP